VLLAGHGAILAEFDDALVAALGEFTRGVVAGAAFPIATDAMHIGDANGSAELPMIAVGHNENRVARMARRRHEWVFQIRYVTRDSERIRLLRQTCPTDLLFHE